MIKFNKPALGAALILAMTPVLAHSEGYGGYGDHMMGGWGYGPGFLGALMMLVFWGLIIALIVLAVRWFSDQRSGGKSSDALDILKDRLAKGEIDPEEYEMRRKALEG